MGQAVGVGATTGKNLLLGLCLAFVLSGCSRMVEFGLSVTADGTLEVISSCTDRGFDLIEITSPRHSSEDGTLLDDPEDITYVSYDYLDTESEPPSQVLLIEPNELYRTTGSLDVPAGSLIRVYADYADPTIIGHSINVSLDQLSSDRVAVSDADHAGPSFRMEARESFLSDRGPCSLERAWINSAAAAAGILAVIAGVVVMVVRISRDSSTAAPED